MGCKECSKDDDEPCCSFGGVCTAAKTKYNISNCIHCGGEMHKIKGFWYHHTQVDLPENERWTIHDSEN